MATKIDERSSLTVHRSATAPILKNESGRIVCQVSDEYADLFAASPALKAALINLIHAALTDGNLGEGHHAVQDARAAVAKARP